MEESIYDILSVQEFFFFFLQYVAKRITMIMGFFFATKVPEETVKWSCSEKGLNYHQFHEWVKETILLKKERANKKLRQLC